MIPLSQMQSKVCFDKMVAKSQSVHLLHPLTVGQRVEWPPAPGKRSSAWVALWRKEEGTQQNHVCAQTGARGEGTTRSFRSASARMGEAEEELPTHLDQTTPSITLVLALILNTADFRNQLFLSKVQAGTSRSSLCWNMMP